MIYIILIITFVLMQIMNFFLVLILGRILTWIVHMRFTQLFFYREEHPVQISWHIFGSIVLRAIEVWPLKGIYLLSSPKEKQKRPGVLDLLEGGNRVAQTLRWKIKRVNIISKNKAYSRDPSSLMTPLLSLTRADKLKLSVVCGFKGPITALLTVC